MSFMTFPSCRRPPAPMCNVGGEGPRSQVCIVSRSPATVILPTRIEPVRMCERGSTSLPTASIAANIALQVAGDGDAVDRIRDLAVLDPESGRAARIIAGDRIDALPHQFRDQQPAAHAAQQSRRNRRRWPRPAGCARRRHWRWSPGRACAPNSCRARSAAARRRATSARFARRHAFRIERRRAEAASQEGQFLDREPIGKQLRADAVHEEARLAVQRAAGHRRRADGRSASARFRRRTTPARRRSASERGCSRAAARSAARRPTAAAASRSFAESAVVYQPSRCIASPRPAISAQPMVCWVLRSRPMNPCEFAYTPSDALLPTEAPSEFCDARSSSRPASSQASARSIARSASIAQGCQPSKSGAARAGHQRRIGQARGRIVLGIARDRAGLLDRRVEAVLAQVRGAGAALALAEIDSDGDAAVAGRLDGFHRAHAHVDVETVLLAAADLGLAGAACAAAVQQLLRGAGQVVEAGVAVVGGERDDCVQWLILVAFGDQAR